MDLRTITTERSVWIFDLCAMRFLRLPRNEAPEHPRISYTDKWDDFTKIEPVGDTVVVHRPVPFGTGALRQTGRILSDTRPGPWPEPEPDEPRDV